MKQDECLFTISERIGRGREISDDEFFTFAHGEERLYIGWSRRLWIRWLLRRSSWQDELRRYRQPSSTVAQFIAERPYLSDPMSRVTNPRVREIMGDNPKLVGGSRTEESRHVESSAPPSGTTESLFGNLRPVPGSGGAIFRQAPAEEEPTLQETVAALEATIGKLRYVLTPPSRVFRAAPASEAALQELDRIEKLLRLPEQGISLAVIREQLNDQRARTQQAERHIAEIESLVNFLKSLDNSAE